MYFKYVFQLLVFQLLHNTEPKFVLFNFYMYLQITRIVQYEKTSKDVSHWEPVVKQNRKVCDDCHCFLLLL